MILMICYSPIYIINFLVRELFFGKERELSFIVLSKFFHWVSFLCVIGITLIIFFGNSFSKYLLYILTSFFVIVSFLYKIQFVKNIQGQKGLNFEKLLSIIFSSLMSVFPAILYFMFVIYPTVNIVKYEIVFILFYFFSIVSFGLSCFVSHIVASDYFLGKKFYDQYNIILIFINIFFIFAYTIYLSYFSAYNISLYAPRFIEKPQNSSWYILHNGNTNSDKINGFSKTEIQNLKLEFKPQDKDVKDIKNPNTLYGYMAWNLGNTKVFCPQSVDFFDDKGNNKEKSEKCLVIDGKYLQLISDYYIEH